MKATVADQVLTEITESAPLALSNSGIAEVIGAPTPSVRRATGALLAAGKIVVADVLANGAQLFTTPEPVSESVL